MIIQSVSHICADMSVNYVQVKVAEGILRGQEKVSNGISKVKYYAFQGVPFAKPPIEELRFKPPQPLDPWEGVRDALEDGTRCCQIVDILADMPPILGDEDCLYLNVFTPELSAESNTLKPVLLNIHGGGFTNGSGGSDVYSPEYFMDHGVVFVSPNYRCGALGFLSLQNDEISGNAGLKDQVQALIWTHKNISRFGGDPENISLIGLSAGGASVEYLLLTELTKGLFKRAIIQSGSTLNTWSFNSDPRNYAVKLAELLGYTGNTKDDKSLENFLKNCSAKEIVKKQNDIFVKQEKLLLLKNTFAPCMEKEGEGQKFITLTPREIFKSGNYSKVPIIIGLVNNEGLLYYIHSKTVDNDLALINTKPELCIPINLNVPENEKAVVARQIMQFYFGNKPLSLDNIDSFTYLIGDLAFGVGINESTKYFLQGSQKPVYCYGVSYETITGSVKSLIKMFHPNIELKGVPHAGDLDIMFKLSKPFFGSTPDPPDPPETDLKYIKLVTTMLTSFAKTGNPNYDGMEFSPWEPATTSEAQYLDIGNKLKMTPGRLYEERLKFWNNIYTKYGHLY